MVKHLTVPQVFGMKNEGKTIQNTKVMPDLLHTTSLGIFGCEKRLILINGSLTQILTKNLAHTLNQTVINLVEWNVESTDSTW